MLRDLQSEAGFVWAYRFDGEGKAELMPRDIMPGLAEENASFVWLHLDLVHSRAKQWIAGCSGLPPDALALFVAQDEHQRLFHNAEFAWGITFDP